MMQLREKGMDLSIKFDGKRPASLDYFLKLLDITENEFIDILMENEIQHWGFDKDTVQNGEPLPDMDQWNYVL